MIPPSNDDSRLRRRRWCILGEACCLLPFSTLLIGAGHSVTFCDSSRFPPHSFRFPFEGTEDLEFHPCYEDFQCARLLLPLDYFNGTYPDETVSIAITKLPAQVPVTDDRYGGPVLINPGGPGGSGVAMALSSAKNLQVVIDPAAGPPWASKDARFYDIIGFDPRGIGFTEPAARCMPDLPTSFSWQLRMSTEGMLGSSDAALGRLWSMAHAHGASCKQALDAEEGPDIKQYMSTASVATDMLRIAEKHAEWVEKKSPIVKDRIDDVDDTDDVKLQYWGFSYGTYLGSTFASMYPDRVGRLVLDGVVNVWDYDNSLGQGSLHDTEKGLMSFYTYCLAAGPEACPLTTSTSSIETIKLRVQSIIESVYHDPITIVSPDHGPEIFTYTDLKSIIFVSLYSPFFVFPFVAQLLAAVETRTGTLFHQIARGTRPTHIYQCPLGNSTTPATTWWTDGNVPPIAILCGDGRDQTSATLSEFHDYWRLLASISPATGAIWSMLRLMCTAWPIKAVYRFGGDDEADANYGAPNGTSHPILWVSNTADPVTPLASGRLMQARFPGSGLLVQDSAGHCSLALPTPCTITRIRDYFQRGELPAQHETCVPPVSAWSLNSTDPASPFYDPELGPPAEENEVRLFETEQRVYEAAAGMQEWAAGHEFLGGGGLVGERARAGGWGDPSYGYRSRFGSVVYGEDDYNDDDDDGDDDDNFPGLSPGS
ncbi:alpha/beta-hydrolase [Periconia macrospinosa]|uniref:Alpha/beta-hydrolase n=1 Tax=Periconia macrospinosa TaxID=97972 RepID=A0A2V1DZ31_9PLEO|nr:alpha/beta-hydrolase [Periconia macrospinosa]